MERDVSARRVVPIAVPMTLAGCAVLMLAWTWRTWPDILIDFGREVYVPWQLATGKVLYRDIAYFSGPLSPYLNSLWFRVFGAQLDVLLTANLALVGLLAAVLHHLARRVSDRLSAFVACLVFLALFAFAQYVTIGNYNYVAPYSHELTHGLLVSLTGIACLGAYATQRRAIWLLCAGGALGLTFLTKVEVFLAALLALLTGLVLSVRREHARRERPIRAVLVFALGASIPVVAAYLLLRTGMSSGDTLDGLLRQYSMVTDRAITSSPFYARSIGTDDVSGNIRRMLLWLGGYALVFVPAFVVAVAVRPDAGYRRVVAAVLFSATAVGLSWLLRGGLWLDALRPLPLVLLAATVTTAVRFRGSLDRGAHSAFVLRAGLLVLATVLLAKIALAARLYSYGFALAMPATLVLVVALVGWVPAAVDRLGGYGAAFRAAAAGALVAAGAGYLAVMQAQLMEKTYTVVAGTDAIRTDPVRGPVVAEALTLVEHRVDPGGALAVLPEGVMVNFLTRRIAPTPYVNFMPIELLAFGEERILQALQAAPPDVVLLVDKDVSEYGLRSFGSDYGAALVDWVHVRYERVTTVGEPEATGFGIEMMRHHDSAGRPARTN
jgi:4-amino-4-deoxy-L-arabinose transferase-like glycosyltransferase